MPTLYTIPNEILDGIAFYLEPLATAHLLSTCRSLSYSLAPAMHRHAITPKDGMHALHWAAEKGHLPLVKHLLSHFSIDLPDSVGRTALQASAWARNNRLVLDHLILNGADVDHIDHRGFTALHYACEGEHGIPATAEATVRILISHGANVNIVGQNPSSIPLERALVAGFPGAGRLLLEAGADPNWLPVDGVPFLHTAAQGGDEEWLAALLDFGADIDSSNHHESTALLIAVQYAYLSTVKLLVERGANIRCADNNGDTPLIIAMREERFNMVKYLARLDGIDLTSGNQDGDTPVNLAMRFEESMVSILLENGYPVDYFDQRGYTAMHLAVLHGRDTIVETLWEMGANLDLADDGDTPLLWAILEDRSGIAEMLIERGADPENCGSGDHPPLMVASEFGLERIVSLLLEQDVDVNYRDKEGRTAMALAQIMGHGGVVEILAAHGGII